MVIMSRAAGMVAIFSISVATSASCHTWRVEGGNVRWRESVKASILEQVDRIGEAEIARLNAANETYKTELREVAVRGGFGLAYKAYEEHETYRLVDIQMSNSILYPLKAIIEYEYVRYETIRRPIFPPMNTPFIEEPYAEAGKDTDFLPVERKTKGLEYYFETDGQWNGEEGRQVW